MKHLQNICIFVSIVVVVFVMSRWAGRNSLPSPISRQAQSVQMSQRQLEKSANHAGQTLASTARVTPLQEVAFQKWQKAFLATPNKEKAKLIPEGVRLAQERRRLLAALIQTDPERALQMAVPVGVRRGLPPEIRSLLEERVSGRGQLALFAALPQPGQEARVRPNFRTATFADRRFDAYVYGRRKGQPTRNNIPLHGIAIDGKMAVSSDVVRILEPEEIADLKGQAQNARCCVSGEAANPALAADVGGEVVFFCHQGHVAAFNEQLIQAESGPPSSEGSSLEMAGASYTLGTKTLILIRIDFSDLPGLTTFSNSVATNLVSSLNSFYAENSYGRAGFKLLGSGSALTPIFRMPRTASYYGGNDDYLGLRADARAAAASAGYILANYDFDVICMGPVAGFGWAGLGYVGAPGAWVRDSFSPGVPAHELGHNFGLNHANFWSTTGNTVIGSGSSIEYGDSFDTMGAASAGVYHFNTRYKQYLNWLDTNEFYNVSSNGTYRIYAHDYASSGRRALKVAKQDGTNYWVEFRQKITANSWLMNGAGLRWGFDGNERSQLLDNTPGSPNGRADSAIVIGRTFSDILAGIHITPVAKGGTSPESLDVVVNLGTFPDNATPSVLLTAAVTNAGTNVTLNFSASASDADADVLAYYWDFGDGTFGANSSSASKSWGVVGEYVVRCVVSDMKGGVASDSVIVRIGSPTTYRISGTVTMMGAPLQGARVYASSNQMTHTDSDGTYHLVGLSAGSYTVNADLEDLVITPSGFSNPVTLGPSAVNVDFLAAAVPPTIVEAPTNRTVTAGLGTTFAVTALGTQPRSYQWNFEGNPISGATARIYNIPIVSFSNAGNYSVIVSNAGGSVTSSNALLTVVPDTSRPNVTIYVPGANFAYTNTATLTIEGSAWDDISISNVLFSHNNAAFETATLLNSGNSCRWNAELGLTPGTNCLTAVSVDGAGNTSAPVSVKYYSRVFSTLQLVTNGTGAITSTASRFGKPTNSASLLVGYGYQITASTGTNVNWVLTNVTYTASGGESGVLFSNTAALASCAVSFLMKSNMIISANFISNPFVRLAGSYNGLFHEPDLVRHHSAGYVTLKTTPKFGVSGKLSFDGNNVPFTGKLSLDGTFCKPVSRAKLNKPDLLVNLTVNMVGTNETVSGTIVGTNLAGLPFSSVLSADRVIWTTNDGTFGPEGRALAFTNRYTMIITGFTSNADGPVGYGAAPIDLTSIKGVIKLSGNLSDDHNGSVKLSQSTVVSRDGLWPLYAPLYASTNRAVTNNGVVTNPKEYGGLLMGWLAFRENTNANTTNLAPFGTLDWIRVGGWTNSSWPGGFTNQMQAIGSRHLPPATGVTNRIYNFTNASVVLSGGQLPAAVTNWVFLKTNNAFFVDTKSTNHPVTHAFKASLAAKLGTFSGSFTNGTVSGTKAIPYKGVMLQDQNCGLGYFTDHPPEIAAPGATNSSGNVIVLPEP